MRSEQKDLGLIEIVAGLIVVVLAVLLFGVTKDGGGPDWVNIIMATAGGALALTGFYNYFRDRGTGQLH